MKVLLASSATGGHIYPALAIAEKIKRRQPDAEFLFIGSDKDVGSTIVTDNGYDIRYIRTKGFDRKHLLRNFKVLRDFLISSRETRRILDEFKPDIVIGTGGYVCGPVVREASKMGIKAYIQEQNAVPGMANKLAEKYATKIFVGFAESVRYFKDASKIIVTGNPVRRIFLTLGAADYRSDLGIGDNVLAVLIFGGSTGALRINAATLEMLENLKDESGLTVFFITGKLRNFKDVLTKAEAAGLTDNPNFHIMEYAEDIYRYYGAADLVVSRSGALTVSEIAAAGKPSLLIPSPNVTGNHQYFNAKILADRGAAIIIEDAELTGDRLTEEILKVKSNKNILNRMAEAASEAARPDSVNVIYEEIMR